MANQVEGRFKIHFPYHMVLESVGGPEQESTAAVPQTLLAGVRYVCNVG